MNILVTLNSGLGADLGPNFNLTANVGSVTPSTVTKSQLTTGVFVDVDASATQITVTSTGTCSNSIVLNISGQTTTTTTLGIASFVLGRDGANFFTACTKYTTDPITYYSGVGAVLQVNTTLYLNNTLTNNVVAGYYSNGTDWYLCNTSGVITSTGSCSTTTTTSTSTTSTSTSTTTAAPTTSTSTSTTTLPPETFSLGYSATTDWQACFAAQTNYYAYTGELLQNGLTLYTDITLSTQAPSGWYSNGSNYWYIPPACKEYTFTNNLGYDESVSYYDCNGVVQILLVYDATTSSAVCIDSIINLNGLTDNYNGAGSCPASTTGIFQDEAVCPTTTTTSTTSTSTSTTSTSSTSTSTSTTSTSTSTTTAAPTSTSTTTTTTVQLPPGDTSTTTTSTTEPPTTTTTTTTEPPTTTTTSTSTSTSTSTTTAIPTYTYLGKSSPNSGNSGDACSSYLTVRGYISLKSSLASIAVNDIIYDSYPSTPTNGGNNWVALKASGVGDAYSFQINSSGEVIQVGGNCSGATTTSTTSTTSTTTSGGGGTTTSTSTSTTTLGTTAAPTVDIYINTVSSLDTPITGMTIDGVAVTWSGAGPDFILSAGDNGQFTSTKIGTYDVVISYGTHTSGQRITFTDSNNVVTCQTINGSGGTFTITGATITAATTISVYSEDGICA